MIKIMRIGKIKYDGKRYTNVFIKVSFIDGRLSITGVIGPKANGNTLGGCGQIDMEFDHRDKNDNDNRYTELIKTSDIEFADGWNSELWLDLLDIWKRWHLNDMNSACEHQKELGWTYETHHNPTTFVGEKCPVCGYKIGSAWLKEDIPYNVLEQITNMPDADISTSWYKE